MRALVLLAAAGLVPAAVLAAGPADALKSRMRAGEYEMKMTMNIPGMPAGMGPRNVTTKHCVTAEDIEGGRMGSRDKEARKCEIRDFTMAGNTATYRTVCPNLVSDVKVAFAGDGYVMDMTMQMSREGKAPMTTQQHVEARYLGACRS